MVCQNVSLPGKLRGGGAKADSRLTELGTWVDSEAFLYACIKVRQLARLLECGDFTETAVLK